MGRRLKLLDLPARTFLGLVVGGVFAAFFLLFGLALVILPWLEEGVGTGARVVCGIFGVGATAAGIGLGRAVHQDFETARTR